MCVMRVVMLVITVGGSLFFCLYICNSFNSAVVVLATQPAGLQVWTSRTDSIHNTGRLQDGSSLTRSQAALVGRLDVFHAASAEF